MCNERRTEILCARLSRHHDRVRFVRLCVFACPRVKRISSLPTVYFEIVLSSTMFRHDVFGQGKRSRVARGNKFRDTWTKVSQSRTVASRSVSYFNCPSDLESLFIRGIQVRLLFLFSNCNHAPLGLTEISIVADSSRILTEVTIRSVRVGFRTILL